jgi:2'-5' RNA ligase
VPKYLNECRKRLGRDRPDIKWAAGAQRHITLRFLGELSPSELPDVQAAVTRTAASCQPFEARLTGWGAFPEVSRPRTLWVGVDAPYGAFQALERELDSELSVLGIPPKEKPCHPHVTLGRVRSPRGLNGLLRALKSSCPTTAGLVFTVDCVTLFESTLTAAGPEYTTLLEAPLGILNPES